VEGERRGVGEEAAGLAALVAEGDISDMARTRFAGQGQRAGAVEGADLLERLDRFRQTRAVHFSRERLRGLGVDVRAAEAAEMARRQFAAALRRDGPANPPTDPNAVVEALAMATLAASPDRVMRRRSPGSSEALLATGGVADVGAQPPDDLLCACVPALGAQEWKAMPMFERLAPLARAARRADWIFTVRGLSSA
jgi:ATP-dependent helicase HrpB